MATGLLHDGDGLSLLDHLALLDQDLADRPRHRGGHRDLHLHRLEDHQRVVLLDLLADLGDDLPQVADQLRLDLGHRAPPGAKAAMVFTQRPVNFGARFSRKARVPSAASSLRVSTVSWEWRTLSALSKSRSSMAKKASRPRRMSSGLFSVSPRASSPAAWRTSARGTTRFTSPQLSAVG